MDHVIRLLPGQTQFQPFKHGLFDRANDYKLTPEEFKEATKEQQQLGRMWLVRLLVGRYLFHWPMTEVWLDEMCSAGLEGLCEFEDPSDTAPLLRHIQLRIETTINDHRSIVRASFSTNKNRSAANEDLEYGQSESLCNVGEDDMDLLQAQLIDILSPEDQQTIYENRYAND